MPFVNGLLGVKRHTSAEGAKKTAKDVIISEVFYKVDLIPSHLDLFLVDLDLASATAREFRLRQALQGIMASYDMIVCDCPPNLTIPTQNALAISSHYVVPVSPDFLSGLGVGLLLSRIGELAENLEATLEHAGIVISRVGRPAEHREQTTAAIRAQFKAKVFPTEITERVAVSKCAATQTSIFSSSDVDSAAQFRSVSMELLKRMGLTS